MLELSDFASFFTSEKSMYPLLDKENDYAVAFGTQRMLDFSTGRYCARNAMEALGISPQAVLMDGRLPIWPEGIVGSISHSRKLCGAVAARLDCYYSVGLDIEEVSRFSPSLWNSICTDAELAEANAEFAIWLCTALAGTGVRLIHVGSAAEYGDPHTEDLVSERSPQRAVGPYAQSKSTGTEAVLHARSEGLDACVVRVFNIVGYPIPAVSPIHQWLTDLQALGPSGGSIDVWWPPTTRDFVMIEDVARALVDIAAAVELPALLNLCSGTGLGYGAIAESIAAELGIAATVKSLDKPGIETVVGDPTLLEQTIGWVPAMTLNSLAVRVVRGESATPSGGGSPANR